MVSQIQKKQDNKNIIGPIISGVAGSIAIAGVAVAATIALKDEKTRKRVVKVLNNVKDQAIDYADTLKTEPNILEGDQDLKSIASNTKRVIEKNI